MFSKACEYGIRASIYLAQLAEKGRRGRLRDIAKAIDSPVAFTAKILQSLAKDGIIMSVQGPHGGYEIPIEALHDIRLSDIVKSIDGDRIYQGCGLGLKKCNAKKPCPLHYHFKSIRDELRDMLQSTSLHDLNIGMHEGLTFLKR